MSKINKSTDEIILRLSKFGVAFGERIVLSEVDMEIPASGPFVLMGPAGTGKSTLLRSATKLNEATPLYRTWGELEYFGDKYNDGTTPALVAQNTRLLMADVVENIINELPDRSRYTKLQQREIAIQLLRGAGLHELCDRLDDSVVDLDLALQRHLAIARTVAANPALICIDEPTTGLNDADADRLIDYLQQVSRGRAVLVVLHNQAQAQRLGGMTALLAGGRVQECCSSEKFFSAPDSVAAREYIKNGNCTVPAPDAAPDTLDETVIAPPPLPEQARKYVRQAAGPRGFMWLKKGMLAGTPRPGIVAELEDDLEALKRVGVTVLVSLTMTPVDSVALAGYGIAHIESPIVDMQAPTVDQAFDLVEQMTECMNAGDIVAVHCRAGLGRTGTMLAAQLIYEGYDALDALETVRRVEPKWVQSEEQVAFLVEFARAVAKLPQGRWLRSLTA